MPTKLSTPIEQTPLPAGWRWAQLGDVCEKPQYGYTAPSTQKVTGIKYLRITDIQDSQVDWDSVPYCEISEDEKGRYVLERGNILFARTGATTGKSFLIQESPVAVFASYLIRVRPHTESLLPEFLYTFLQSDQYWSQVEAGKRGGAQPNMNATLLAEVMLPLPPLPEQRCIAARLNAVMAEVARARAAAQAALDAAKALPAALLRAVFESEEAKGWEVHKLGDVCETPQYGYTAPATRENTGTKILRITDIQDSRVDWQSVPYCEIAQTETEKYLLKKGDVLFARTGATTGKNFLITHAPTAVFASYLIRVRPHSSLLPDYLYNFLQSDKYWEQVEMGKRGGAQSNMNATLLADVSLPVPAIESQKQIIAQLESQMENARQLRASAQSQLDAINALPAAYLRRAFRGKL